MRDAIINALAAPIRTEDASFLNLRKTKVAIRAATIKGYEPVSQLYISIPAEPDENIRMANKPDAAKRFLVAFRK